LRSRIGLIVPRYGHRIVERNRLKRRLREILRIDVLPRLITPDTGTDILVRARRNGYEAGFAELKAELVEWWERRWSRGSSSS
jgi:ribonuclease P protein component